MVQSLVELVGEIEMIHRFLRLHERRLQVVVQVVVGDRVRGELALLCG